MWLLEDFTFYTLCSDSWLYIIYKSSVGLMENKKETFLYTFNLMYTWCRTTKNNKIFQYMSLTIFVEIF